VASEARRGGGFLENTTPPPAYGGILPLN